MKKGRPPPLELCSDTLAAVTKELTEFLGSYTCTEATSEALLVLSKELEKLVRRHCLACQGTLAIICGDHQLGVRPRDEAIALLFVLPNDCTPSSPIDTGFENSSLHDALLDAGYTILAYTTTCISLMTTSDSSTIFYHVSLATDSTSHSFYDRSMINALSKLYSSSSDAVTLYLLLWKMALHSSMKQSASSPALQHGKQSSATSISVYDQLPPLEELLYLRLHLHLLTFYFITAYPRKRMRAILLNKSKGANLLTMLVSLADHMANLQRENTVNPSCIVTDWSICSLVQGAAAIKLGVPETGSLYFASYGLAGLLPFNDKGGHFIVFLMTLRTATLKLLSAMKLSLQPDKSYLSILVGNYKINSTTTNFTPLSTQSTPRDLSFRMAIASSETSSAPSSLHSTPTQKRVADTTDMHIPLP